MLISGVKVVESIPVTSALSDQSMSPHMQCLDLSANVECQDVDKLIGQDFADALLSLDIRKVAPGEPYAVRYKFGWGLSGHANKQSVSNLVICNFVSTSPHFSKPHVDVLVADINRLWELENELGS